MKLGTQVKSRTDVMQYCVDDVWSVKTITLSAATVADLEAGSCINADGTLVTSSSTVCYVVADFVPAGRTSVVVFDKLVTLFESALIAKDAAGLTKAKALLAADAFKRLI